ncbi:MAG TPA: hybrid sensor histidine kinase/response regulator, partial [Verrucomicrobiae bacterium]
MSAEKTTDVAREPRDETIRGRAQVLFNQHLRAIYERTDKLFGRLIIIQWLAGILGAYILSPRSWTGASYDTHVHVWAAIFLGGFISFFPVLLARFRRGSVWTRHTIAAAQMMMSALLIHLSGGRIETHFHVFGSLAFLAFYRDWRVLMTASVVVYLDHFLRGIYWPQSVYGVVVASQWRAVEHAAWVGFELIFLLIAIRQSVQEMWQIALRQVQLERTNENVEALVRERTSELQEANSQMEDFCYS